MRATLALALASAAGQAWALGVFDGPGGRELYDALVLTAYLVSAGFAGLLLAVVVTNRKRRTMEQRLRLANAAFESSVQGMMLIDGAGLIRQVNPAFERLTGHAAHEVIGRDPSFIAVSSHDPGVFPRAFRAVHTVGSWEGELWAAHRDGSPRLLHMTLSGVRTADGGMRSFATSFVDITQRRRDEQRIHHLALHDALTDLPNRAQLRERTEAALAQARRDGRKLALLFVDLDRFKNINDSLGHAAGDQLLRRYAHRIREALRAADLVARQGGDEFTVLVADIAGEEDAARVARKLIEAVQRPFTIGTQELQVSCSVGIALYPESGADFEALMRNADTAMYAAKDSGRSCFRFHAAEMSARANMRLELETELRRALREGTGLWLAYQPQFELLSTRLAGMEALVRWQHPERGPMNPAQFIPLAEDSGLIVPLGEWVMREACATRARWLARGLEAGPVAVNVSAVQFRAPDFVAMVRAILAETTLPPALLELEVTESVLMAGVEQVSAVLSELGAMGLRLSIDDFGTGYSSLGYLKRLPVHKLKIDRSFVMELPDEFNSRAIADAVIGLARGLGLAVIAEGVETDPQAVFLRERGCGEAQGYFFARPMPAAEFDAAYVCVEAAPAARAAAPGLQSKR